MRSDRHLLAEGYAEINSDLPIEPTRRQMARSRMVEQLVDVAISVLHHDTTVGSEVDKYERDVLSKKFAAILAS